MARVNPTLVDVAALAGVCVSTASRILRATAGQDLRYAVKTQERVRGAAEKLGYRPSRLARGLISSRTEIIGLIIPTLKDSFFPTVVTEIQSRLAMEGQQVILASTESRSEAERAAVDDLLSWGVDGIIAASAQGESDAALYWDLWSRKVPFVLIDRAFPDTPFCSVTTDDYQGVTQAIEHLLSIGRRSIAAARPAGSRTLSTRVVRYAGYVDTLNRHGIPVDDGLVVDVPASRDGGREAIRRLMELSNPPDALFCFSDIDATGAMEECLEKGIRIPEDLALVGYADLEYSSILRIPLTTVRQPCDLMARTAADMLLTLLAGKQPAVRQSKLPVELMIRESTVSRT